VSKRHIMASSWQKFEKLMKQEMRKIYSEIASGSLINSNGRLNHTKRRAL